jgi:drug/metabolite transporter (DMT)-like permease
MLQPWFTSAAYEHASVGQAGPFRYVAVIFAAFLDWLCWGQVPDLTPTLGFLFITAGGIWVISHSNRWREDDLWQTGDGGRLGIIRNREPLSSDF